MGATHSNRRIITPVNSDINSEMYTSFDTHIEVLLVCKASDQLINFKNILANYNINVVIEDNNKKLKYLLKEKKFHIIILELCYKNKNSKTISTYTNKQDTMTIRISSHLNIYLPENYDEILSKPLNPSLLFQIIYGFTFNPDLSYLNSMMDL